MKGLILHMGSKAVDREVVLKSPTPPPTHSHVPIPHGMLVEAVQSVIERDAGLRLVEEAHGLSPDNFRYFGLLGFRGPNPEGDSRLVVGVRNSHDKSIQLKLGAGRNPFVCDNLSFHAEVVVARKHTKNILEDFPALTTRAVGKLVELWNEQGNLFERYKETEMGTKDAHHLFCEAVTKGFIPCRNLPIALDVWKSPRHAEYQKGTAWTFWSACTEATKGNLQALPNRSLGLQGLLNLHLGLDRKKSVEEVTAGEFVLEMAG